MHLVHDHQLDLLSVGAVPALARNDVPLLGSGHDDLRRLDLRAAHGDVARQLLHADAVGRQALAQVAHHLRHQRLHRRDVHNFEAGEVEAAVRELVQPDLVQNREHRHVGLTRPRGRAHKHVVRAEERAVVHPALDAVELVHALEGGARPLRHVGHLDQLLVLGEGLGLERGHVHLLVPLLLRAVRPRRQLAPLVAHQVAPLGEGQRLQLQRTSPRRRRPSLLPLLRRSLVGGVAVAQAARLLADPALHGVLALAGGGARGVELLEDLGRLRGPLHLRLDARHLRLVLRARQPGAPDDLAAVLQQHLDQRELVHVQQQHQVVLDVHVLARLQRLQNLLGQLLREPLVLLHRIPERLGHLALQPVRVDVLDIETVVVAFLPFVHVHGVQIQVVALVRIHTLVLFGVTVLLHFVHVAVALFLLLVLKLHGHSHVLIQGLGVDVRAGVGVVRDQLAGGNQLRKAFVGHLPHERLQLLLFVVVFHVHMLQHRKHLLRRAADDIRGLVSELHLDGVEQRLVRRARLFGLGAVHSLRPQSQHVL
mmetsp:Transcript_717/g.1489  ORF Transcript_717/g.1489 Transcript_717/m.1489 type:complete len:538 (+) Transcript_717:5157-6770(+)